MIRLCLVIETPRAGDAGHRFLTSCSELGEMEIARMVAEASRNPVSDTFISVCRQVTQTLKNSTVREGTERIILTGVEVGDLKQSEINAVHVALTDLFVPLERLIDTLSWQSIERTTVIARPELGEWIDRPEFRKLPTTTSAARTGRFTQDTGSIRKWRARPRVVVGLLIVAFVLGFIYASGFWKYFTGGEAPDPRPAEPPGGAAFEQLAKDWDCTEIAQSDDADKACRFEQLGKGWGCTKEELAASLLRAANWDRRTEADDINLASIFDDREVRAIMTKIEATIPPEQFLVSRDVEQEAKFGKFVSDRGAWSAKDARDLRCWLYSSWQELSELKHVASRASGFLREIEAGDAFSASIIRISEVHLDVGTGEGFLEPTTPLFDRQDVMIYRALGTIHQTLEHTGVAQKLIGENAKGRSDLPTFVARLEKSRDRIPELIAKSRRNVVDQVRAKGVGVVRDDAYKRLEEFLVRLSSFRRG